MPVEAADSIHVVLRESDPWPADWNTGDTLKAATLVLSFTGSVVWVLTIWAVVFSPVWALALVGVLVVKRCDILRRFGVGTR